MVESPVRVGRSNQVERCAVCELALTQVVVGVCDLYGPIGNRLVGRVLQSEPKRKLLFVKEGDVDVGRSLKCRGGRAKQFGFEVELSAK